MNYFESITFCRHKDLSTKEFGRFIIEPIPAGSGRIYGNAIRRMLMFTVPGSAILKISFDDALHEFSIINEVVEDVQEIIMNLRKVVFSMKEDMIQVRVEKDGPCVLTAKDIPETNTLKVVNPDQYIATINSGGSLNFELEIHSGIGYVDIEENQPMKESIGEIILDTDYSPIVKVGYRSDRLTDKNGVSFDRLVIDVEGNGSIELTEAMKEALTNLRMYSGIFGRFTEFIEEVEETREEIASIDKTALPIAELNLSVRSRNCLKYVDVATVGDLAKYSAQELMEIKNFGKKSLVEIRHKLSELGLALKGEGIVDEEYDAMEDHDDDK